MNQRLKEAASCGDMNSLYLILEEDAYILERIDQVSFVDTPLHISVSVGHVYFSLEMMRLKPSFARKLNPEGYSLIHLALQNEQKEMVFRFIDVDRDLISIQGREGLINSVAHCRSCERKRYILSTFLVACPKSIKELTIYKESALHIAVKNRNFESLKTLLEWIRQTSMTSILNWCDDEGNNVMHLAALGNQIEMVKLLINKVDIKSKNSEGQTALDIMKEQGLVEHKELKEILHHSHIILKQSRFIILLPTLKDVATFMTTILLFLKRLVITDHREIIYMSKEDRNAILVVSVLIATATYQTVLSPPDEKDTSFLKRHELQNIYVCFIQFNTLAFVASMIEICLHLPSGIGYALHLVLPLVICYALLMIIRWSFFSAFIAVAVIFVLVLLKIPLVRQKVNGDLKPKKFRKLGGFFKRSPSLEKELAEISVHFGRSSRRTDSNNFSFSTMI